MSVTKRNSHGERRGSLADIARRQEARRAKTPICQWFARCGRPAVGTTPHPILGDVPTCARCHDFATAPRA